MAYWRGLWGAGSSVLMMDNDIDEHLYGVWSGHEGCGVYGLFLGCHLLGRLFIAYAFVYLCFGASIVRYYLWFYFRISVVRLPTCGRLIMLLG